MQTFVLLSSKLCGEEKALSGSPPISSHLCFRVHAQLDNNLFGSDASLCNHCCFHPLLPCLSCDASTRVCVEHLQNSGRWKLAVHSCYICVYTKYTYMFLHICIYASIYIHIYLHTHSWLRYFPSGWVPCSALLHGSESTGTAVGQECCFRLFTGSSHITTVEINQFIHTWGMVMDPVCREVKCICEMTISRLLPIAHLSSLKGDDNTCNCSSHPFHSGFFFFLMKAKLKSNCTYP